MGIRKELNVISTQSESGLEQPFPFRFSKNWGSGGLHFIQIGVLPGLPASGSGFERIFPLQSRSGMTYLPTSDAHLTIRFLILDMIQVPGAPWRELETLAKLFVFTLRFVCSGSS